MHERVQRQVLIPAHLLFLHSSKIIFIQFKNNATLGRIVSISFVGRHHGQFGKQSEVQTFMRAF